MVLSEWIKLRSLRSTLFTLLAAVALTVGLGVLIAALRANDFNQNGFHPGPHFDSTLVSLRGIYLAQLPIGVLGVLMITGEYATGMIRATVAAVPKRLPVLWAKALVFTVVAFIVGGVASLVAFLGGQAMLHSAHVGVGLGSPGAARAVLGGAPVPDGGRPARGGTWVPPAKHGRGHCHAVWASPGAARHRGRPAVLAVQRRVPIPAHGRGHPSHDHGPGFHSAHTMARYRRVLSLRRGGHRRRCVRFPAPRHLNLNPRLLTGAALPR